MEKEQVNVEERAIRYIAKAADGSMRDALSLLDQCIAFYLGQELTYEKVLETLGAVDTEVFSRLLRQILDKNVTGAIQVIDGMVIEGRGSLSQILHGICEIFFLSRAQIIWKMYLTFLRITLHC